MVSRSAEISPDFTFCAGEWIVPRRIVEDQDPIVLRTAGGRGERPGAGVAELLQGPLLGADTLWSDALQYPGAFQMGHLRALIESRPFLTRIPAPELVPDEADRDRIHATRDSEGCCAFVYAATGGPFTADLSPLSGRTIRAAWYDPRTGKTLPLDEIPNADSHTFTPPSDGPEDDWVLVLDDAAQEFSLPGRGGDPAET